MTFRQIWGAKIPFYIFLKFISVISLDIYMFYNGANSKDQFHGIVLDLISRFV